MLLRRGLISASMLLLVAPIAGCFSSSEFDVVSHAPQSDFRTCGTDALFMCISSLGKTVEIEELRRLAPATRRGCSMHDMAVASRKMGAPTQPVSTTLFSLRRFQRPAVLHVNNNHFIAYLGERNGQMMLYDNQVGVLSGSARAFRNKYRWSGNALRVGAPPGLVERMLFSNPLIILPLAVVPLAVAHAWRAKKRQSLKKGRS